MGFLHSHYGARDALLSFRPKGEIFLLGQNVVLIIGKISRCTRLCENYVHGSTALTTNEMASLESKYLSARPELSRRVPIEFSHSLALEMTKT